LFGRTALVTGQWRRGPVGTGRDFGQEGRVEPFATRYPGQWQRGSHSTELRESNLRATAARCGVFPRFHCRAVTADRQALSRSASPSVVDVIRARGGSGIAARKCASVEMPWYFSYGRNSLVPAAANDAQPPGWSRRVTATPIGHEAPPARHAASPRSGPGPASSDP